MKTARNDGQKNVNCNFCHKSFKTKQTVKQHIDYRRGVHVELPQYGCIICEQNLKPNLTWHNMCHKNTELYLSFAQNAKKMLQDYTATVWRTATV